MALSPGILLELASIRDAIERGVVRYDLGPGDYPYKRDLGARRETRVSVQVVSAGIRGRLATGVLGVHRGVRAGARRAGAVIRGRRLGAVVEAALLSPYYSAVGL